MSKEEEEEDERVAKFENMADQEAAHLQAAGCRVQGVGRTANGSCNGKGCFLASSQEAMCAYP